MGFTTKISGVFEVMSGSTLRHAVRCNLTVAACFLAVHASAATNFLALAQHEYRSALEASRRDPASATGAVALAQAACQFAELLPRDYDREDVAKQGIEAARAVISRQPTNAAAYYWLGNNLGELARTKSLGALSLVKEMAEALLRARELDDKTDHGGPDRSVGLLYRDAPGWPTSVGSTSKAKQHLQRAVQISPDFPENQLCLLESYE